MKERERTSVNGKYILVVGLAVFLSWVVHEFAHWLAGQILGNPMAMTLNTSYPTNGDYKEAWHANIISAAGPIITLLQAFLFYFLLMRQNTNKFLFPFLLACLYMRTLAGFLNFINLNDEGRISKDLGIGTFTLSAIVVSILFYFTYRVVKERRYSTKFVVLTILLIMFFSSVIVLLDQAMKIQLL